MAISFVGSAVGGSVNGLSYTINVGGIAGIQDGDYIIVAPSVGPTNTTGTGGVASTNGVGAFTTHFGTGLISGANPASVLKVVTKFRSGDTTITITGSGNSTIAQSGIAYVFRGVDPTTPLDTGARSAQGTPTVVPDCAAVGPTLTADTMIVAIGQCGVFDTTPGTVTGFSAPVTSAQTATNSSTTSICHAAQATIATVDPAAWSSFSAGKMSCVTFALRAAAVPAVTGTFAVTEGPDVAAFAATLSVAGTLAVTEGPDVAAFAITLRVTGSLAATEGADVAAFAGQLIAATGTLDATEASDVAAFAVTLGITGALAATEAADVAAFTVAVADSGVTATFAATEGSDVAAFAAQIYFDLVLDVTEGGDVAAFDVQMVCMVGVLNATEAPDVVALFFIEREIIPEIETVIGKRNVANLIGKHSGVTLIGRPSDVTLIGQETTK